MSTWAVSMDDPLRHPWFSHPSLKRKHSDSSDEDAARNSDSDQDVAPSFYPTPPPESAGYVNSDGEYIERKRRRCDTIERRMARMYIDGRNVKNGEQSFRYSSTGGWQAPPMSAAPSTASDVSFGYTAGSISPVSKSALLPQYAVEEPVSPEFKSDVTLAPSVESIDEPPIMEVRMKGAEPAWYEREKDRIVVTDLDEAAEEAEKEHEEYKSEAEPHPDAAVHADSNADYSFSSVLLDHIKKQANFPFVPKERNEKDSVGALVLFKPPPLSFFSSPSADADGAIAGGKADVDESQEVRIEEIDENEARSFSPTGNFTFGNVSMDQEEDIGEPMDIMDVDVEM